MPSWVVPPVQRIHRCWSWGFRQWEQSVREIRTCQQSTHAHLQAWFESYSCHLVKGQICPNLWPRGACSTPGMSGSEGSPPQAIKMCLPSKEIYGNLILTWEVAWSFRRCEKCKGSFRLNTTHQKWSNHSSLKFRTCCSVVRSKNVSRYGIKSSFANEGWTLLQMCYVSWPSWILAGFEQCTLCGIRLSRSRRLSVCLNASKWPFSTRLVPSLHCLVSDAAL